MSEPTPSRRGVLRSAGRLLPTALAAAAIALVTSCAGCADRLLLYPSTEPLPFAAGLERKTLRYGLEGDRELEVFVGRSEGAGAEPELFVLGFDGNASRAEACARELLRRFDHRRVEVWAVNYPGYGGSSGEARLAAIPSVALLACDALLEHAGTRPILVYGNSIGAGPALHVAARRPVRALLLQNPVPLRRMILQRHGWWNLWLMALPVALAVPVELNAMDTAPLVRAPAVVLSAREDTIVPPSYQRLVYDALGGPKTLVEMDTGHNDAIPPAAVDAMREALAPFLPAAGR